MSYIIDRRLNSKDKNAVNRQRFLRRYRSHIKRAVSDAVSKRSIKDIENGEDISIPRRSIQEPQLTHGSGGRRDIILPGNKDFVVGDRIRRPDSGGSGAGRNASNSGEGMDEFVFQISQEEFLHYLFEDLELPNLVKRQLSDNESFKLARAGFSEVGNPSQINIIRTMRSAHARRIAISGVLRKQRRKLMQQLTELDEEESEEKTLAYREELKSKIARLSHRIKTVPFIDDFDLKFNLHVKHPQPVSKAVMFCIMDVSGSMDQNTKDIAKRFFILLYLFLQRNYEKTDVIFIRHHTYAKEVDEEEFFYSRETGGTVVSSALELMDEIIKKRYPPEEWNIYSAQASDGDNWHDDSPRCYNLLVDKILPISQYFCYVEITEGESQELWTNYRRLRTTHNNVFAMRKIRDQSEIYPVFKQLFKRKMQ